MKTKMINFFDTSLLIEVEKELSRLGDRDVNVLDEVTFERLSYNDLGFGHCILHVESDVFDDKTNVSSGTVSLDIVKSFKDFRYVYATGTIAGIVENDDDTLTILYLTKEPCRVPKNTIFYAVDLTDATNNISDTFISLETLTKVEISLNEHTYYIKNAHLGIAHPLNEVRRFESNQKTWHLIRNGENINQRNFKIAKKFFENATEFNEFSDFFIRLNVSDYKISKSIISESPEEMIQQMSGFKQCWFNSLKMSEYESLNFPQFFPKSQFFDYIVSNIEANTDPKIDTYIVNFVWKKHATQIIIPSGKEFVKSFNEFHFVPEINDDMRDKFYRLNKSYCIDTKQSTTSNGNTIFFKNLYINSTGERAGTLDRESFLICKRFEISGLSFVDIVIDRADEDFVENVRTYIEENGIIDYGVSIIFDKETEHATIRIPGNHYNYFSIVHDDFYMFVK